MWQKVGGSTVCSYCIEDFGTIEAFNEHFRACPVRVRAGYIRQCSECGGLGRVAVEHEFSGQWQETETCLGCGGSGFVPWYRAVGYPK
jgi:hypothetical protein